MKTAQKTAQKTVQKSAQKTAQKTAQMILSLIKNNPYITRVELATQCGITEYCVKWHLGQLKNNNIICRIGADKGGYWKVIEANQRAVDEK